MIVKSLQENFRQSIVETTSIICVSALILFLLSMTIFISLQGMRYFLPANVHLVSLNYSDNSVEKFYEQSFETALALKSDYERRFNEQYSIGIEQAPKIEVEKIKEVMQISTHLGETLHGNFKYLDSPNETKLPLSALNNLMVSSEILASELITIQDAKLRPLHQEISILLQANVDKESQAYKEKLAEFNRWQLYAKSVEDQLRSFQLVYLDEYKIQHDIQLSKINSISFPNKLSTVDTVVLTFERILDFLSEEPKQAATSGGVYPAIFGTVMMVFLMTIVVAPFGIIAAIYLNEYAPNNKTTAFIRIGISNMAAVPSVVYGVFGLGFFVYTLGGSLDELLYSDSLPSPTFGTPGILWASLTMGLLTLPVVIVSAEEGLNRVPTGLREGSYALGATKFETVKKVVLPMASPGLLTGIILAIARAAGEVAPLILVGAVKFAPNLPLDGEFPYLHLERQFMHLGVFIYDGAFHNQVDSQSSSMMFASCMLLLVIVFILNISAVMFRKKLRDKYERSFI